MQAVELSSQCGAPSCDVMTGVTGQIDAPHKCFSKLWHRHRDVSCHPLLCFHSKFRKSTRPMLCVRCQQLPPNTRLL